MFSLFMMLTPSSIHKYTHNCKVMMMGGEKVIDIKRCPANYICKIQDINVENPENAICVYIDIQLIFSPLTVSMLTTAHA